MIKIKTNIRNRLLEEVDKIFFNKISGLKLYNFIYENDIKLYLTNGITSQKLIEFFNSENNIERLLEIKAINSELQSDSNKLIYFIKIRNEHIKSLNSFNELIDILNYNIFTNWDYHE
jgi:hypothetical protein